MSAKAARAQTIGAFFMPNVALHSSQVAHRLHHIGSMLMARCGKRVLNTIPKARVSEARGDHVVAALDCLRSHEGNVDVGLPLVLRRFRKHT